MSKNTTAKPLTDNTRKLIIIIAIALVAVIILSVALALILRTEEKTPADNSTDNSTSSTLPIKNGDFLYASSEATGFPRTAVNWTKYGYKAVSGSTHDFQSITGNDKSVMGIIDVDSDNWSDVLADLAAESVTDIQNPGVHSDELEDTNVYMIANKQAFAASILSDSTSVASGASVKITVWLNATQVTSGNAVIMIQKSTVSAKEENWYAYDFQIADEKGIEGENGWRGYEFYIFNRESSTKYIRVSVGLGDVYQQGATADEGKGAEGILFVDDISYETVTANEYREQVDNNHNEVENVFKPFQIIENEDITDESKYFELKKDNDETSTPVVYASSDEYVNAAGYSPFTIRDDFKDGDTGFVIYKVSQQGENKITALRLTQQINLAYSQVDKDHYHISFWLRVEQNDGHQATKANVFVQKQNAEGEWEDLSNGSFTSITTSQEIADDTNCGWVKYDIYLKPSSTTSAEHPDVLSILFVLGNKDGYSEDDIKDGIAPRGSMYVTSPAYEQISYKDYNNASSGSYVKKINLIGDSSSTSVTNGSFSDVNNIGDEPTSWTPVFAGDNAIYKDGQGNQLADDKRLASLVEGSGVNKNYDGTSVDDAQKNVLQVKTNGTNFGYISSDISLSSRTVYVFSVLVKTEQGGKPFVYLVDTSKERDEAIVGRIEDDYDAEQQKLLDNLFDYSLTDVVDSANGWVRYYLVYVTGNETASVRLALFNGAIDGVGEDATFATGTVLYDNVKMKSIGTYSFVDDDETEEPTHYLVEFSANSGYEDAIDALTGEDHRAVIVDGELALALGGNGLVQPDTDAWDEMTKIPEKEDNGDEDNGTTTKTPSETDWGLLMSVISSVLLVAALLIVFVIKLFQRKRNAA